MTAAIEGNHAMIAREQIQPSSSAPVVLRIRCEAVNQHRRVATAAIFIVNLQPIRIEEWHCVASRRFECTEGERRATTDPDFSLECCLFQAIAPRAGTSFGGPAESHPPPDLVGPECPCVNRRLAWPQQRLRAQFTWACSFFCHVLRRCHE